MDFIVRHLMPGIGTWYGCCVLAWLLMDFRDDKLFTLLFVPPIAAGTGAMLWLMFQ